MVLWKDVISFGHLGLGNVFVSLLFTPWYPWCFCKNVRFLHFFGRPFDLTSNLKPTRFRRVCSTKTPYCTSLYERHSTQRNLQNRLYLKHQNSIAMNVVQISIISYFCSCFCDCRQCLLNCEVQTWQMAPCQNRWNSAVLLKLVSLKFMHSTLRYSPKRIGHP